MKNTLKLDHENGLIVMDRTFAKKAENTMSTEYAHLQNVRRDYPTYQVIRREIKKNPNTEHYKGFCHQRRDRRKRERIYQGKSAHSQQPDTQG